MANHTRCGIIGLLFLITIPGHAQFNRTFVASNGNDASPDCSRGNPCRSFSGALGKTNAGGEVIALDSAGYGATLTITRSVSIIAPTGIYGGMTPTTGTAISVNAPDATVVLRGLYLNAAGATTGISVTAVGALHVDNMVVNNFSSSGIDFSAGPSFLFVNDSIFRGNGRLGGSGIRVRGL
jgi:hypothetical protein